MLGRIINLMMKIIEIFDAITASDIYTILSIVSMAFFLLSLPFVIINKAKKLFVFLKTKPIKGYLIISFYVFSGFIAPSFLIYKSFSYTGWKFWGLFIISSICLISFIQLIYMTITFYKIMKD